MSHLILIDGSAFLHRAFHSAPDMQRSDGTPIGGINAFCSMIWRLIGKMRHATHVCVVGDNGVPTWRHREYPLYKANRPPRPSELKAQLAMMEGAVAAFGLRYIALPGFEADDIIATYVHEWTAPSLEMYADNSGFVVTDQPHNLVTIVSSDKDLMQLIDDRIIMFEPKDEKIIRAREVKAKFGVEPHQMVDYLAIVGDASDNVPGVPSIGAKTAAALLAAYGSVDGIYENLDKLSPKQQGVFVDALPNDRLPRSQRLVTLRRDVPSLPDPGGFTFDRERDYRDLAAYCRSNQMESLARRVEEGWYQ